MSWLAGLALVIGLGALAAWTVVIARRLRHMLNLFQVEEYENARFARWLLRDRRRLGPLSDLFTGLALGLAVLAADRAGYGGVGLLLTAGWAVLGLLRIFVQPPKGAPKKPLVYTPRARRLIAATAGLAMLLLVVALAGGLLAGRGAAGLLAVLIWVTALLVSFIGFVLIGGNLLMWPVEENIRRGFRRQARRRLAEYGPTVIGITGSYGKTTTKSIVAQVLQGHAPTLKTPASFNTPMGICRTVNGDLKPECRYFVVEMGAYTPGNIADLCTLAPPRISVVTAVGPQHLERFKTLENVARAKFEIVQALPADGIAVLNVDDPQVRLMADALDSPSIQPSRFTIQNSPRVVRYGLEAEGRPRVTARDVQTGSDGLALTLVVCGPDGEQTALARTHLLGRYNVSNILAATAVALECGMTLPAIAAALVTVEPAEHRLQVIRGAGGVTVIDDSYNANPLGVRMALEVLAEMPGRQKVLVTPGLVELGPLEVEENRRLGIQAAMACDVAILVGPRRVAPILEGLRAAAFPEDHAFVVNSLTEATDRLQSIVRPGDVVLFANDLPDTYNEP